MLTKARKKKLEVAEMRMLRWMREVTKLVNIKNEKVKDDIKEKGLSADEVYDHQARNHLSPQEVRFPLTLYLQKTSYYKQYSSMTHMSAQTHAHDRTHGTNAEC